MFPQSGLILHVREQSKIIITIDSIIDNYKSAIVNISVIVINVIESAGQYCYERGSLKWTHSYERRHTTSFSALMRFM